MKKIAALTCGIMMAVSVAGCGENRDHGIAPSNFVLQHPDYSYDATDALASASYAYYSEEYLELLNESYQLASLVNEYASDFENVQAVTHWVTNLWQHDGINEPEENDPLFILDEVTKNGKQFRCVEYGTVISGCLLALDIPARPLGLKMKEMETIQFGAGHVAIEVYLQDLNKWIFVDGQWGVIPILDSVPLNALEFSQALNEIADEQKLDLLVFSNNADSDTSDPSDYKMQYYEWIKPYLYYFDTGYLKYRKYTKIMLTPIGAKRPTVFQIKYPLYIDIYTDSVVDFYSIPEL